MINGLNYNIIFIEEDDGGVFNVRPADVMTPGHPLIINIGITTSGNELTELSYKIVSVAYKDGDYYLLVDLATNQPFARSNGYYTPYVRYSE